MKILIFTPKFYPFKGGLETFNLELATRLQKIGHQITVCTLNHGTLKKTEKYKDITIQRLDAYNVLKDVYAIPALTKKNKTVYRKLSQEKYNIVITNTRFFTSSFLGARFAHKEKIPHIHIEHGNVFVKHNNPFIWLLSRLYEYTLGKWIFTHATQVVGISTPCAEFAKKRGAKKTSVIYNAIDTSYYSPGINQIRKKLNISTKYVVTFVGRLIYAKGVQDLILAIKDMPDITLLIIGDGPYKKTLEQLAKDAKVHAIFTGTKDAEFIREALRSSTIFVNPSYSEGLPTSVLEAGSIGIPIVATNVGGTKEIIQQGKTGFLVEAKKIESLKKSINLILQDANKAKHISIAVQQYIHQQFSWEAILPKWLKLLKTVKK